jgi:hypothetical protein
VSFHLVFYVASAAFAVFVACQWPHPLRYGLAAFWILLALNAIAREATEKAGKR